MPAGSKNLKSLPTVSSLLPSNRDVLPTGSCEISSEKRIPTDHGGWHLNMLVPVSSTGKLAETRLRAAHSDVSRRHQDCHPRAPSNSRRRQVFVALLSRGLTLMVFASRARE